MSFQIENFLQVQKKILKEIKRSLESEKLSLWSYKADLNTISIKQKKIINLIEIQEEIFYNLNQEATQASHEIEFTTELITSSISSIIIETITPWKVIQDICGGICRMLGFEDYSWKKFQVNCN